MSGSEPAGPLFPDWTRDATSPSLRERREVLEGRLGRLSESLQESTRPRFAELDSVRRELKALPEGKAWQARSRGLTVAQQQRQVHVASTRRGRRLALALAAGVLAISAVGWASKRPRPLKAGDRTVLRGQRIHTTGQSVAVAGLGVVTMAAAGETGLRLHEGRVEVSSQDGEQVSLSVGPYTALLGGGRMDVQRAGGTTQIRALEGRVRVSRDAGEEVVLLPEDASWTAPPPEAAESCEGAPDQGVAPKATPVPAGASPGGLLSTRAASQAFLDRPVAGVMQREPSAPKLSLTDAAGPRPRSRPPPTLSFDADYRAWTPPNQVRTSGGTSRPSAVHQSAGPTRSPSGQAESESPHTSSGSGLSSASRGQVGLPTLGVAHEVVHTLEGSPVPMAIDPESGLGFCPIPERVPDLVSVPDDGEPVTQTERAETRVPKEPGSAPVARGPLPPALPTREIPPLPTPSGAAVRPEAAEQNAASTAQAREALLGVVFGAGTEGPECAP